MLFAGSRSEVGPLLGIAPVIKDSGTMQERNMICNLKNPPDCFYEDEPFGPFGNTFDTSLKTGSPYQTPSRKDFEDEMKPGEGGPPSDFNIQDYLLPIKKADASNFFNEGTGIEKEGFDSVPDYLKNKLREMEWKKALQEASELENPELIQELTNKAEVAETWNEGTGIEKGGFENAPQWLRDQMWKQDLRKRQELGLEPVAY